MFGISDYMDYEGQRLAERIFQVIIVLFGSVGWLYGYYVQDFKMTVMALGAGFALAFLVTIPPWPLYRRSPLKWVSAAPDDKKKRK
ncbi:Microsomal signal peptidase 12kDa subunit [Trinorchestia longiramus]|nr:Microsomal signal peptidase 12kDa subunit [Trinorchestia longiramus]